MGKNKGFFQPSALLQFWGILVDNGTVHSTTFRLRRAELRVKGEIAPGLVGYAVMIDPAKLAVFNTTPVPVLVGGAPADPPATVAVPQPGTDRSILQDFFITFMSEYADVSAGQFKIPVSWEGFNSSSKLVFPERARSSRHFGDRRDIGLKVEKKIGDYFFYSAGIFDGSGLNRADEDNEKDLGLRLEVYPVKGLTVGVLGYTTTLGSRDGVVRDRIEGDVRYEGNDLLVQAEYIRGWDGPEGAHVEGHGGYGALGYTFIERIQPVLRVGLLDPNLDQLPNAPEDRITHYEFGMNYYLRQHEAKLSLAVGAFDPGAEGADTSWEGTLAAQVSF